MIALEAKRMSMRVCILDPSRCCPAASVSDELIVADFKDDLAIRKLARISDVITYEIELANSKSLIELASKDPKLISPSPETLRIIQDKYKQKSFLNENNVAVPPFTSVESEAQLYNR